MNYSDLEVGDTFIYLGRHSINIWKVVKNIELSTSIRIFKINHPDNNNYSQYKYIEMSKMNEYKTPKVLTYLINKYYET